jgi:starch synthase
MENTRVLYISQEITPFLPETQIAKTVRNLSQGMLEAGVEIRNFIPRFGVINERRHQLHEVIRLSGMNLIINDEDHPLIIKVASIPQIRMQVYFIDNEEYFKRKAVLCSEDDKFFEDNDERSMFFCRGVLETVKKLGWSPDVIHCHGFMTALMPMYIKEVYQNDPHFAESKVVYTSYNSGFDGKWNKNLVDKVAFDGVDKSELELLGDPSFENLEKFALKYSDAWVAGEEDGMEGIKSHAEAQGLSTLDYQNETDIIPAHKEFYESLVGSDILAE